MTRRYADADPVHLMMIETFCPDERTFEAPPARSAARRQLRSQVRPDPAGGGRRQVVRHRLEEPLAAERVRLQDAALLREDQQIEVIDPPVELPAPSMVVEKPLSGSGPSVAGRTAGDHGNLEWTCRRVGPVTPRATLPSRTSAVGTSRPSSRRRANRIVLPGPRFLQLEEGPPRQVVRDADELVPSAVEPLEAAGIRATTTGMTPAMPQSTQPAASKAHTAAIRRA